MDLREDYWNVGELVKGADGVSVQVCEGGLNVEVSGRGNAKIYEIPPLVKGVYVCDPGYVIATSV